MNEYMRKRMNTCICITESLCCTPETNTTLNQLQSTEIKKKKIKPKQTKKELETRKGSMCTYVY